MRSLASPALALLVVGCAAACSSDPSDAGDVTADADATMDDVGDDVEDTAVDDVMDEPEPDAEVDADAAPDASPCGPVGALCTEDGVSGWCDGAACQSVGQVVELSGLSEPGWVNNLAWSPDGTTLAVANSQQIDDGVTGELTLWNVADAGEIRRVETAFFDVAWSPDGSLIALGGASGVEVRDPEDWSLVWESADGVGPVAFSHSGDVLAAATGEGLELFDTSDWSSVGTIPHFEEAARMWRVAFTGDDSTIVTALGQLGLGSPHGDVRMWDAETLELSATMDCTSTDVAFSPDGSKLAAACWYGVTTYEVPSGEPIEYVQVIETALTVGWTPDGEGLVVGSLFGPVVVHDGDDLATEAGRLPFTSAKAIAWSPDGTMVAVAGWNSTSVQVWTLQ